MRARKSAFASIAVLGLLFGLASVGHARITRIDLQRVESPTFDGTAFGDSGQYEKLVGRAYGELDPKDELNRGIVYIDKAPRNAAGRVEYSFDVYILKPLDMSRGNRTAFYDVVNRGDQRAFAVFHFGANTGNNPATAQDAGDGFLMKQGYTLVASGWQGDVLPAPNRLGGQFPVATEPGGKPITKLITMEYVFNKPAFTVNLGMEGARPMRPYAAVPERMGEARLLRRAGALAARETIPAGEWSFGKCPDGKNPEPSAVDLCYPAGFSTDTTYELVYVAQDPLVMGIAFAETRDLISFLRYERSSANPLVARDAGKSGGDPLRHAIGFGRSQSGRYLKDLVYQGFNQDEARRVVFDGIMPLVTGSRLMNTNMEFATPGRVPSTRSQYYYDGDRFPHTYATLTDPVTGRSDGQLARCTQQRACPKVIHMDTGTEAWGGRASLVIADSRGAKDLPVPDGVRLYYLSGSQHVPTAKPAYGICKNLANPNPYRETLRALLVAMQGWVETGKTPPPTRYPRVSDGTLVAPPPAAAFEYPKIPGAPWFDRLGDLYVKDFSMQPPRTVPDKRYVTLVPKVDADGNDIAGVHSATREVPLGTYTGWNLRKAGMMENEFCDLQGSYIPFAKTATERGADPRLSLQERYVSKDAYVAKVEAATQKLVADRFLLPEDAARLVADARARDLGF